MCKKYLHMSKHSGSLGNEAQCPRTSPLSLNLAMINPEIALMEISFTKEVKTVRLYRAIMSDPFCKIQYFVIILCSSTPLGWCVSVSFLRALSHESFRTAFWKLHRMKPLMGRGGYGLHGFLCEWSRSSQTQTKSVLTCGTNRSISCSLVPC